MACKVMVVDDDTILRRMVCEILKLEGIHVIQAASGAQCLKRLRNGFRGVVLMDIHMPKMDGWDAISTMVAEGLIQNIMVCMLTGDTSPGAKSHPLQEYVFDYIAKPFKVPDLISRVKNALGYLPEDPKHPAPGNPDANT